MYLELICQMAEALQAKLMSDMLKVTDLIHKLVQSDLLFATILPMLPVHTQAHFSLSGIKTL